MTADREALTDLDAAIYDAIKASPNGSWTAGAATHRVMAVLSLWLVEHDRQRDEQTAARVQSLHQPRRYQSGSKTHGGGPQYSETCSICRGGSYPCATLRALRAEREDVPTQKSDIHEDVSEGAPAHSSRREVTEK